MTCRSPASIAGGLRAHNRASSLVLLGVGWRADNARVKSAHDAHDVRGSRAIAVVLAALAVVVSSPFAGGCGNPAAAGYGAEREASSTCPFGVRGARVKMEDVEGGVVLTMRAFGDVGDIRRRARDAAAMYGAGARRGAGHHGKHGGGEQHGIGLAHLGVPVTAVAEDTPDGARILVKPKVPGDLEKMREALVARERLTRTGACP